MASLCAGYISFLGYYPPSQIKLVTFGQPRVGDLAYATYIDKTVRIFLDGDHKNDFRSHTHTEWCITMTWSLICHQFRWNSEILVTILIINLR